MSARATSIQFSKVTAVLMMALALAIPNAPFLLGPLVIGIVLSVILDRVAGAQYPVMFPSLATPFVWMALLFLLHVLAMAWTADQAFGWMDIGMKASLLVFPIVALTIRPLQSSQWSSIMLAFVIGCLCAMCVDLVIAVWSYAGERSSPIVGADPRGLNLFFSSELTRNIHPSYMAWYFCMALAIWFFSPLKEAHGKWNWVVAGICLLGVFLCASKLGWITIAVLLPWILLKHRGDPAVRKPLLFLAASGGVAFGGVLLWVPSVRAKVTQAVQAVEGTSADADDSSSARLQVWDAAWDVIGDHPWFGSGTGDVKNELIARYTEKGYAHAAEKRLNAHSQFFQTTAALGFVGLGLLLLMLIVPMWSAFRIGDHLTIAFYITAILNWSVESMLEVQAGVVFFSFFALLLFLRPEDRPSSTINTA